MEKMSAYDRGKEFYPDYLIEILAVVFLTLGAVIILALLTPIDTGREINFSAAYQPKPEWYFLWSYQVVRYFPGRWMFVGTALAPLLALALLVSIPFTDRGVSENRNRRVAIACFIFVLGGFLALTMIAALSQ
ncbi:MAG: hypothetical protein HY957_07665 [Nitrospirae bacterium]|nr:hypothetical protein [Nitrospirota bacterium]